MITKNDAVQILRTVWEKLSVTTPESAWSIDEDNQSEVPPGHGAGASQSSCGKRRSGSTRGTRRRVCGRHEGIAIAAVMKFAPEEKPFVAMRKIVQYSHDVEKDPNLARLHSTMKNQLKIPVDEKMFRAKKDS
jgi:hypothetical protein